MSTYLYVGLGGALGAMLRYMLSTVTVRSTFPMMTFITNLLGAICIGFIVGIASEKTDISPNLVTLLKTGFCGGFTTFSTFSLETLTLFENHNYGIGTCYAVFSLVLCIVGVWVGRYIAKMAA